MAHARSHSLRLFKARLRFHALWLSVKWRGANTTISFLERPEFDERCWLATRHYVKDGCHGKLEGTGWIEFTSEETGVTTLVKRDKVAENELRGRPAPRPFVAIPKPPPTHVSRPFVARQMQAVS